MLKPSQIIEELRQIALAAKFVGTRGDESWDDISLQNIHEKLTALANKIQKAEDAQLNYMGKTYLERPNTSAVTVKLYE